MRKNSIGVVLFFCGILVTRTVGLAEGMRSSEGQSLEKGEAVERLMMRGTEIQGTVEKPHVVYIVPWKETTAPAGREIPIHRSFRNEILEPVVIDRFQRQWGHLPRHLKGGDKK